MSPELKDFYKCLQHWIEDGLPDHSVFKADAGICENLGNWTKDYSDPILAELKESFGGVLYPFNTGTFDFLADDLYKNLKRLAWIHKHAMED